MVRIDNLVQCVGNDPPDEALGDTCDGAPATILGDYGEAQATTSFATSAAQAGSTAKTASTRSSEAGRRT